MFENIVLFGKYNGMESWETIEKLTQFLQNQHKTVFLDAQSCDGFPTERYQVKKINREADLDNLDLAIVISGDGTFLDIARNIVDKELPIIGINLGHLGFLTDISQEEMFPALEAILAGHFKTEERNLLSVSIQYQNQETFHQIAFNDVVLHKDNSPRMIEFETFIDQNFLHSQRSDGLIVSTPTGSTAYSLSAGGPLISPELDVHCLVSINPHTMSNRPIVISGESTIELRPHEDCNGSASIICDGQITSEISAGYHTFIKRHPKRLKMIHPLEHNHFKLLRTKLNWGQKL